MDLIHGTTKYVLKILSMPHKSCTEYFTKLIFLVWSLGPYPVVLGAYYYLCAQKLLLLAVSKPYVISGIEFRLAIWKPNPLHTILALQSQHYSFLFYPFLPSLRYLLWKPGFTCYLAVILAQIVRALTFWCPLSTSGYGTGIFHYGARHRSHLFHCGDCTCKTGSHTLEFDACT